MFRPSRALPRPFARLLTGVAAALFATACTAPQPAPEPRVVEQPPSRPPPFAYESFDLVWRTVDEQHFDTSFDGERWAAIREEFRPRVESVRSDAELRTLLEEMLGRLGQSHFGIIPGSLADARDSIDSGVTGSSAQGTANGASAFELDEEEGDLGVTFRLVEGRIVTLAPRSEGPAALAGVGSGWELLEVEGEIVRLPTDEESSEAFSSSLTRYALESYAARRAAVEAGMTRRFLFLDEGDRRREVLITARAAEGRPVRFGNLPSFRTRVEDRLLDSHELIAAGVDPDAATIGYVAFNIWMVPAAREIDLAIDRHREREGLILDLRGNPGGLGGMAMGIGGHFLDEPVSLGTMITGQGELEFRVNPRRVTPDGRLVEPYAGPLAILVDPLTASTSEIFAAGLQEIGRARVFGQTSAGAALPSIAARLPNGDVFQYAMADFVTPLGRRIEGQGVMPDQPVALSRELLIREGDPVLAEAVRWIAATASEARASSDP